MIYGGDLMSNFVGSIKHGDTEMTRGVILSKISKLIEKEPSLLIKALKDSGVKVSEKATKSELIDKSVESLYSTNNFKYEFSKLLIGNNGEYSNALDPVTAIAEATGKVFGFFGSRQDRKASEEADKRALQMQLLQGDTNKTNWLPIVIISGVLLIGGVVAYVSLRKK
jgi:hypothetical protein